MEIVLLVGVPRWFSLSFVALKVSGSLLSRLWTLKESRNGSRPGGLPGGLRKAGDFGGGLVLKRNEIVIMKWMHMWEIFANELLDEHAMLMRALANRYLSERTFPTLGAAVTVAEPEDEPVIMCASAVSPSCDAILGLHADRCLRCGRPSTSLVVVDLNSLD